jgi:hypothetical protein
MTDVTTIQLDKSVVSALKKLKDYPRQPYNELIINLIACSKKVKMRNQYSKFLHKIQQTKMKELWDNKDNEIWQDV